MRYLLLITISILSVLDLKGQDDPFEDILKALNESQENGLQDLSQFFEGYLNPMMKGVGYGLSNGWYHTAKPHQPLGFDLYGGVSVMRIPDEDLTFFLSDLQEVDVIQPPPADEDPLSTIFGSDDRPVFQHKTTGETFEGPGGIDLENRIGVNAIPVPFIQLGLGLIQNTDLKVRYMPLNIDNVSGNLWGVGLLHDIKQYIPGGKAFPLQASVLLGYNKGAFVRDAIGDGTKTSEFAFNSFNGELLTSIKASIVTAFAGLGYSQYFINYQMKGSYDLDGIDTTPPIEDPLDLKYNGGAVKLTGGVRLNLTVMTLHVAYTFQDYSAITAGFGFTVR